jgi:ATP-dependent Clp protease adaptor protein ClpS
MPDIGVHMDIDIALWRRLYKMSPMPTSHQESSPENVVLEAEDTHLELPPLYKVLLLNDDYTPMDFVVQVLQRFFAMSRERATFIMQKVHNEGRGLCGIYPREIAAAKVEQVRAFALQHQHPLACLMEEN